jgi:hypothetical protein
VQSEVLKTLRSVLLADSPITAITSEITVQLAKESTTLPYVVLYGVSNDPQESKDVTKMDHVRVQVSCFAESYADAADLTERIRTVLESHSATTSGVLIDQIRFITSETMTEDETDTYHISSDYIVRVNKN